MAILFLKQALIYCLLILDILFSDPLPFFSQSSNNFITYKFPGMRVFFPSSHVLLLLVSIIGPNCI